MCTSVIFLAGTINPDIQGSGDQLQEPDCEIVNCLAVTLTVVQSMVFRTLSHAAETRTLPDHPPGGCSAIYTPVSDSTLFSSEVASTIMHVCFCKSRGESVELYFFPFWCGGEFVCQCHHIHIDCNLWNSIGCKHGWNACLLPHPVFQFICILGHKFIWFYFCDVDPCQKALHKTSFASFARPNLVIKGNARTAQ